MTTQWYDYIGYIAAVCIAIFAIPQLINLIKTKNTSYISLLMYSIYLVGCYAFTLAGIFMVAGVDRARTIDGLPLILADGVASIIATIILVWKIKNVLHAKKLGISEIEFCQRIEKEKK